MTDRAAALLGAAGWLLMTWAAVGATGWWWLWPLSAGAACVITVVLWAGLDTLVRLARRGVIGYTSGR